MEHPKLYSYINGEYLKSDSNSFLDIINPAKNSIIYKAQLADNNIIDSAIKSAKEGQKLWKKTPAEQRAKVLLKAANILRSRNQELAKLEVLNTGKPIQEAEYVDIHSGADCLEYFAGLTDKIEGKTINNSNNLIYTLKQPVGVCLGIGAWNYPMQIACWKAAPALACGNSMVFKPSEITPITALKLAEIFTEAGLPNGVFNVIIGDKEIGAILSTSGKFDKISVTGSVPTGKKVMANAASSLTPVTMELGGKSPLIICDDANIDEAVNAAMIANFYTQGEICSNGTRVFVAEKIHDKFLTKLVEKTKKLIVGNPEDPKTQIGALISQSHMDKVLTFINSGKSDRAKLACGGNIVKVDNCNGFFIEPTIFTECSDDMQIVKEEIFGPVMSILKFKNTDEAITRANNTSYGLAAGVFSENIKTAHKIISQLDAGTCWINNYNITPIQMPFGGFKQSGIGFENGTDAINFYTKTKSIYLELDKIDSPY